MLAGSSHGPPQHQEARAREAPPHSKGSASSTLRSLNLMGQAQTDPEPSAEACHVPAQLLGLEFPGTVTVEEGLSWLTTVQIIRGPDLTCWSLVFTRVVVARGSSQQHGGHDALLCISTRRLWTFMVMHLNYLERSGGGCYEAPRQSQDSHPSCGACGLSTGWGYSCMVSTPRFCPGNKHDAACLSGALPLGTLEEPARR